MEYPHSGYGVIKKDVYNGFFSDLGKWIYCCINKKKSSNYIEYDKLLKCVVTEEKNVKI